MTEQTIPAEKVRELIKHFESPVVAVDNREAIRFLRALLPAPPQPTSGLLGRWAKHPEHGDVVCVWDRPDEDGCVFVRWVDEKAAGDADGTNTEYVPFDSLTFPEQATKPEDVPAGEAWLVEQLGEGEQRAFKTDKDEWQTSSSNPLAVYNIPDDNITLISPLTPERPGKDDLRAKYDALEGKYREAVEYITELEQATPRTVASEAEYAALPIGSIVSEPDTPRIRNAAFKKIKKNKWERTGDDVHMTDRHMAQMELPVVRYGQGDEQPAWRIEHDWRNIRVGEYIIDSDDDTGTVTRLDGHGYRDTDGTAYGFPGSAPFIAFPNVDAATPEAIEEAKQARDKEMDK